jgi:hypothetical protein
MYFLDEMVSVIRYFFIIPVLQSQNYNGRSIYWVPQNSRNNSMRQCQLMLENDEKNNKKILYLLDLKIWGLKRCGFDLIYFKY